MALSIKTLTGETVVISGLSKDSTVYQLNDIFERCEGTPAAQQRLIWAGKQLSGEMILGNIGLRLGEVEPPRRVATLTEAEPECDFRIDPRSSIVVEDAVVRVEGPVSCTGSTIHLVTRLIGGMLHRTSGRSEFRPPVVPIAATVHSFEFPVELPALVGRSYDQLRRFLFDSWANLPMDNLSVGEARLYAASLRAVICAASKRPIEEPDARDRPDKMKRMEI